MSSQLNTLDRSTLYVWRALNLLGWPALGALIAFQVHWLVVQAWGFMTTAGYHVDWSTQSTTSARILVVRALISMVAGVAIGVLVARKLYRWKMPMAAIGAITYVAVIMISLEHSAAGSRQLFGLGDGELDGLVRNPIGAMLIHDVFIVSIIPVTLLSARRELRHRS